jgi:hypothetical protein
VQFGNMMHKSIRLLTVSCLSLYFLLITIRLFMSAIVLPNSSLLVLETKFLISTMSFPRASLNRKTFHASVIWFPHSSSVGSVVRRSPHCVLNRILMFFINSKWSPRSEICAAVKGNPRCQRLVCPHVLFHLDARAKWTPPPS